MSNKDKGTSASSSPASKPDAGGPATTRRPDRPQQAARLGGDVLVRTETAMDILNRTHITTRDQFGAARSAARMRWERPSPCRNQTVYISLPRGEQCPRGRA